MRIFFLSAFFAIVMATAASSPAAAKFSLCNKTSYTLSSAIGYVDGDRLATRGWWRLRPGQCKVVLPEKTVPGRYFVYAEGIPGHEGPLRTWSGDTPLCVENSGFFNLRNQEVCRDDPSAQRDFVFVEVTPAADGTWQTDFTEASNFTVYSAEVAGVQRLLRDLGQSIRRIDGSLGRETRRVLAGYRKEKGLGDDASIDDELIDQLIADANARESKLGFFFCNKAGEPVWSAIATPSDEENYEARGWWKLESGACAKILKGELAHDHYYVYGVIEGARGAEKRLAGGDKTFCVNAVKFATTSGENCTEKDLDEAVYKRIEVGGAKSTTFDFLPDMFVSPPTE